MNNYGHLFRETVQCKVKVRQPSKMYDVVKTAAYTGAADLNEYVNVIRSIFLPPEESEIAQTAFEMRK